MIANPIEKQIFEEALTLSVNNTRKLLEEYKGQYDLNKIKSNRGHGFLFTFLRRFGEEDFIAEYIKIEQILDMIDLFAEYGMVLTDEVCSAQGTKYDLGNVLTTEVVRNLYIKDTRIAKKLMELKANVNYVDSFGNIPLFFTPYYDLCTLYLDKTENPFHVNKANENALWFHVKHLRTLKFLIDYGLDYKGINEKGDSLLLHCVRYGSPECVDHLIKIGLDMDYVNPKTGENILFTLKLKKILDVMIRYGYNIHQLNEEQQTVLFTTNSKLSLVKTLIRAGLDINHRDKYGDTVLHKPNTEHLIELLGSNGFNFNLKNNKGDTVADFYHKRNKEDLYNGYDNILTLIDDKIKEQERAEKIGNNK